MMIYTCRNPPPTLLASAFVGTRRLVSDSWCSAISTRPGWSTTRASRSLKSRIDRARTARPSSCLDAGPNSSCDTRNNGWYRVPWPGKRSAISTARSSTSSAARSSRKGPLGYPQPKGRFSPDQCSLRIDPRHADKASAWQAGELLLPGLGSCRVRGAQFIGEAPKTITASRDALGRYWLSFNHSRPVRDLGAPDAGWSSEVGIDLGVTHFATLSTGEKIDNPRHLQPPPEGATTQPASAGALSKGQQPAPPSEGTGGPAARSGGFCPK